MRSLHFILFLLCISIFISSTINTVLVDGFTFNCESQPKDTELSLKNIVFSYGNSSGMHIILSPNCIKIDIENITLRGGGSIIFSYPPANATATRTSSSQSFETSSSYNSLYITLKGITCSFFGFGKSSSSYGILQTNSRSCIYFATENLVAKSIFISNVKLTFMRPTSFSYFTNVEQTPPKVIFPLFGDNNNNNKSLGIKNNISKMDYAEYVTQLFLQDEYIFTNENQEATATVARKRDFVVANINVVRFKSIAALSNKISVVNSEFESIYWDNISGISKLQTCVVFFEEDISNIKNELFIFQNTMNVERVQSFVSHTNTNSNNNNNNNSNNNNTLGILQHNSTEVGVVLFQGKVVNISASASASASLIYFGYLSLVIQTKQFSLNVPNHQFDIKVVRFAHEIKNIRGKLAFGTLKIIWSNQYGLAALKAAFLGENSTLDISAVEMKASSSALQQLRLEQSISDNNDQEEDVVVVSDLDKIVIKKITLLNLTLPVTLSSKTNQVNIRMIYVANGIYNFESLEVDEVELSISNITFSSSPSSSSNTSTVSSSSSSFSCNFEKPNQIALFYFSNNIQNFSRMFITKLTLDAQHIENHDDCVMLIGGVISPLFDAPKSYSINHVRPLISNSISVEAGIKFDNILVRISNISSVDKMFTVYGVAFLQKTSAGEPSIKDVDLTSNNGNGNVTFSMIRVEIDVVQSLLHAAYISSMYFQVGFQNIHQCSLVVKNNILLVKDLSVRGGGVSGGTFIFRLFELRYQSISYIYQFVFEDNFFNVSGYSSSKNGNLPASSSSSSPESRMRIYANLMRIYSNIQFISAVIIQNNFFAIQNIFSNNRIEVDVIRLYGDISNVNRTSISNLAVVTGNLTVGDRGISFKVKAVNLDTIDNNINFSVTNIQMIILDNAQLKSTKTTLYVNVVEFYEANSVENIKISDCSISRGKVFVVRKGGGEKDDVSSSYYYYSASNSDDDGEFLVLVEKSFLLNNFSMVGETDEIDRDLLSIASSSSSCGTYMFSGYHNVQIAVIYISRKLISVSSISLLNLHIAASVEQVDQYAHQYSVYFRTTTTSIGNVTVQNVSILVHGRNANNTFSKENSDRYSLTLSPRAFHQTSAANFVNNSVMQVENIKIRCFVGDYCHNNSTNKDHSSINSVLVSFSNKLENLNNLSVSNVFVSFDGCQKFSGYVYHVTISFRASLTNLDVLQLHNANVYLLTNNNNNNLHVEDFYIYIVHILSPKYILTMSQLLIHSNSILYAGNVSTKSWVPCYLYIAEMQSSVYDILNIEFVNNKIGPFTLLNNAHTNANNNNNNNFLESGESVMISGFKLYRDFVSNSRFIALRNKIAVQAASSNSGEFSVSCVYFVHTRSIAGNSASANRFPEKKIQEIIIQENVVSLLNGSHVKLVDPPVLRKAFVYVAQFGSFLNDARHSLIVENNYMEIDIIAEFGSYWISTIEFARFSSKMNHINYNTSSKKTTTIAEEEKQISGNIFFRKNEIKILRAVVHLSTSSSSNLSTTTKSKIATLSGFSFSHMYVGDSIRNASEVSFDRNEINFPELLSSSSSSPSSSSSNSNSLLALQNDFSVISLGGFTVQFLYIIFDFTDITKFSYQNSITTIPSLVVVKAHQYTIMRHIFFGNKVENIYDSIVVSNCSIILGNISVLLQNRDLDVQIVKFVNGAFNITTLNFSNLVIADFDSSSLIHQRPKQRQQQQQQIIYIASELVMHLVQLKYFRDFKAFYFYDSTLSLKNIEVYGTYPEFFALFLTSSVWGNTTFSTSSALGFPLDYYSDFQTKISQTLFFVANISLHLNLRTETTGARISIVSFKYDIINIMVISLKNFVINVSVKTTTPSKYASIGCYVFHLTSSTKDIKNIQNLIFKNVSYTLNAQNSAAINAKIFDVGDLLYISDAVEISDIVLQLNISIVRYVNIRPVSIYGYVKGINYDGKTTNLIVKNIILENSVVQSRGQSVSIYLIYFHRTIQNINKLHFSSVSVTHSKLTSHWGTYFFCVKVNYDCVNISSFVMTDFIVENSNFVINGSKSSALNYALAYMRDVSSSSSSNSNSNNNNNLFFGNFCLRNVSVNIGTMITLDIARFADIVGFSNVTITNFTTSNFFLRQYSPLMLDIIGHICQTEIALGVSFVGKIQNIQNLVSISNISATNSFLDITKCSVILAVASPRATIKTTVNSVVVETISVHNLTVVYHSHDIVTASNDTIPDTSSFFFNAITLNSVDACEPRNLLIRNVFAKNIKIKKFPTTTGVHLIRAIGGSSSGSGSLYDNAVKNIVGSWSNENLLMENVELVVEKAGVVGIVGCNSVLANIFGAFRVFNATMLNVVVTSDEIINENNKNNVWLYLGIKIYLVNFDYLFSNVTSVIIENSKMNNISSFTENLAAHTSLVKFEESYQIKNISNIFSIKNSSLTNVSISTRENETSTICGVDFADGISSSPFALLEDVNISVNTIRGFVSTIALMIQANETGFDQTKIIKSSVESLLLKNLLTTTEKSSSSSLLKNLTTSLIHFRSGSNCSGVFTLINNSVSIGLSSFVSAYNDSFYFNKNNENNNGKSGGGEIIFYLSGNQFFFPSSSNVAKQQQKQSNKDEISDSTTKYQMFFMPLLLDEETTSTSNNNNKIPKPPIQAVLSSSTSSTTFLKYSLNNNKTGLKQFFDEGKYSFSESKFSLQQSSWILDCNDWNPAIVDRAFQRAATSTTNKIQLLCVSRTKTISVTQPKQNNSFSISETGTEISRSLNSDSKTELSSITHDDMAKTESTTSPPLLPPQTPSSVYSISKNDISISKSLKFQEKATTITKSIVMTNNNSNTNNNTQSKSQTLVVVNETGDNNNNIKTIFSKTTTLSKSSTPLVKPKKKIIVAASSVSEAARSTLTALSAFVSSSPVAVGMTFKVASMSRISNCDAVVNIPIEEISISPLHFDSHPLRFNVDSSSSSSSSYSSSLSSYRGAAIGNVLLLFGAAFVGLILIMIIYKITSSRNNNNKNKSNEDRLLQEEEEDGEISEDEEQNEQQQQKKTFSWLEVFANAHFPGLIAPLFAVLTGPTFTAIGTLLNFVTQTGTFSTIDIISSAIGLFGFLILPLYIYIKIILRCRSQETLVDVGDDEDDDDEKNNSSSSSCGVIISFWNYATDYKKLWIMTPFVKSTSLFFDWVSIPVVALIDFLVVAIMCLLGGIATVCRSKSCCSGSAFAALFISALQGVEMIIWKPYLSRYDIIVNAISCLITIISSAFAVAAQFSTDNDNSTMFDNATNILSNISVYLALMMLIKNCIDMFLAFRSWYQSRLVVSNNNDGDDQKVAGGGRRFQNVTKKVAEKIKAKNLEKKKKKKKSNKNNTNEEEEETEEEASNIDESPTRTTTTTTTKSKTEKHLRHQLRNLMDTNYAEDEEEKYHKTAQNQFFDRQNDDSLIRRQRQQQQQRQERQEQRKSNNRNRTPRRSGYSSSSSRSRFDDNNDEQEEESEMRSLRRFSPRNAAELEDKKKSPLDHLEHINLNDI